ncbi:unnamed protein product [Mucor fragilis]
MTSSVTRSSRSSIKKAATASNDNMLQKTKSSAIKKKKQKLGKKDVDHDIRSKKQQKEEQQHDNGLDDEIQQADKNNESMSLGKIDATQHPDLSVNLSMIGSLLRKQAWNDFYFARKKVRSDLVQNVQNKITRLEQELGQLNVQLKTQHTDAGQECDEYWVPPERLYTIDILFIYMYICGATNEEAGRDLLFARQPYNGSNTPNLVYSDYESRSTTDSAEDGEATCSSRNDDGVASPSAVSEHQFPPYPQHRPSFVQYQQQQPQHQESYYQRQSQADHRHQPAAPSLANYAHSNNNTNIIYPPYEFEELPQDGRRDWWPYRPTTTTTTTTA